MTRFEKIKKMSIEEFAQWLTKIVDCDNWGKSYVSHTMAICCKSLERELKALLRTK